MKKDGVKADFGWYKTTVTEFAQEMEVPNIYLENYKDLRKRVIEPAIKELTQKDGWIIDLTTEKKVGK